MSGLADAVGVAAWNCFAWVLWTAAVVEVLRAPARGFTRGWGSKIGRLVVVAGGSLSVAGLFLPVGAAVVLTGLRRARHQVPAAPTLPPANPRGPQLPGWPSSEGGA